MFPSTAVAGVRAPQLEAKLPTPVAVYCTENTSYSYAAIADRAVYIGRDICDALEGHPSPQSFARAEHTLYHEWTHVAFRLTDEKQTECVTYSMERYALRRFWRLSARVAQAAYQQNWLWSLYAPLPCSPDAKDPVQL